MTTMKAGELKVGDWFEFKGHRYVCVDEPGNPTKMVVCWNRERLTLYYPPDHTVTPLPDCTGWDWEPGPKVQYRNEHRLGVGRWHDNKSECDEYVNAGARIGYTIRRVWPDGRIEQEFVQEDSYEV